MFETYKALLTALVGYAFDPYGPDMSDQLNKANTAFHEAACRNAPVPAFALALVNAVWTCLDEGGEHFVPATVAFATAMAQVLGEGD